ncbi:MAG: hypothetical protein IJT83_03840 [Victivallales bacterium]|nr:hypothetical protein [Victivallales bacterium]
MRICFAHAYKAEMQPIRKPLGFFELLFEILKLYIVVIKYNIDRFFLCFKRRMNHLTIQLTINRELGKDVKSLERHDLIVVETLPCIVTGKDICPVEYAVEHFEEQFFEERFEVVEEEGAVVLVAKEGFPLRVNGELVQGRCKIVDTDYVFCDEHEYGFYVQKGPNCLVFLNGVVAVFSTKTPFGIMKKDDAVMVIARKGVPLLVNGEEVMGSRKLAVGDRIACGGYEYGYYVQHERVGLSFSSRFLAYLAKGSAGLFLFLEILAMVALPVLFARATMWNSIVASQRINNKLDAMRKQVAKIEVDTFVARAILGELENELDERARYIRQNGFQLRRSQRRRMEAELSRMEEIMEFLASGRPIPADIVRKPSLDEAIGRIIGQ